MDKHLYVVSLVCIATCLSTFALACSKNLIKSIIYTAFFSVNVCLLYLMLDAPDVAMTEAAIGASLSTIMLLELVKKIHEHTNNNKFNWLTLLFVILLAYLLTVAGKDLAEYGTLKSPLNIGLSSQHYLSQTQKEIGIESVVAAILASYRGFDTLGETLVIVMAGVIVMLIFSSKTSNEVKQQVLAIDDSGHQKDQNNRVIATTISIILPLIIYFALFIQINGESSPGGGFQTGAILATIIIGLAMINNKVFTIKFLQSSSLMIFSALGVLIYASIGVVSVVKNASFLNYNMLDSDIHKAQFIGIFIVELGVGMSVTATLVLIYKQFVKAK